MTDKIELSEGHFAALAYGTDRDGTWLWCSVDKGIDVKHPFYGIVVNGEWEFRYDAPSKVLKVTATKQIVMGVRLAGIGRVPIEWLGGMTRVDRTLNRQYNDIIEKYLRTGEYRSVAEFVYDTGN